MRTIQDRRGRLIAPEPVVAMGRALLVDLDTLTEQLVRSIMVEDDETYTGNVVPRDDLWSSCDANLRRILTVLTGDLEAETDPFDAPRETGRRRAEQGVALASVLHSYSVGFRVIWDALMDQARSDTDRVRVLAETAAVVWEIIDEFSGAVRDSYREREAGILRREDRRREALLDALLEGRGSDRAVCADAASALDLPEQGRYVVVVLEVTDPAGAGADALAGRGLRSAWRGRAGREVGLVLLGRASPSLVCNALSEVQTARAGISAAVDGMAEADVAYRMAETALRTLPPGEPGVVELDARLPGALLVTAPDLAARLVHRALGPVLALTGDEQTVLLETLSTWLATGGSAGQTATRLYCHRNTVLNRLRRVEALTSRSVERVDHLVEWSLALLTLRLLPQEAPHED